MARLINKLRVMAHLLRSPFRFGPEAYHCAVYANLLSDRQNRKPETIANAKRFLVLARERLEFHAAHPNRVFA